MQHGPMQMLEVAFCSEQSGLGFVRPDSLGEECGCAIGLPLFKVQAGV